MESEMAIFIKDFKQKVKDLGLTPSKSTIIHSGYVDSLEHPDAYVIEFRLSKYKETVDVGWNIGGRFEVSIPTSDFLKMTKGDIASIVKYVKSSQEEFATITAMTKAVKERAKENIEGLL